ncbi:MAG: hypothetical protein ACRYGG_00055 [Janthinobacterium lividum]
MRSYLFMGFKGEVGFEEEAKNTGLEICHEGRSLQEFEELLTVLFDLKKGKPFRGESLAIKYDLVSSWNTKINITNKPVIKDGSKGSNDLGIINSKLLKLKKATTKEKSIQYRAFRISFEDKTRPSFRVNSFCFKSSVKSSLNVPIKGLVLTTTILAITVRIKNAIKAEAKSKIAMTLETSRGAIHGRKIESLFLVQYVLLNMEIICLNLFCAFTNYHNTARYLSQAFYDLKTDYQVHHQPQLFLLFQQAQPSNLFRRSPHAEL